jgi:hypothetical protein
MFLERRIDRAVCSLRISRSSCAVAAADSPRNPRQNQPLKNPNEIYKFTNNMPKKTKPDARWIYPSMEARKTEYFLAP